MNGKKTNAIYVVGHVNPDTDSIASAMGYAWLLQDQGHNAIAARAGLCCLLYTSDAADE